MEIHHNLRASDISQYAQSTVLARLMGQYEQMVPPPPPSPHYLIVTCDEWLQQTEGFTPLPVHCTHGGGNLKHWSPKGVYRTKLTSQLNWHAGRVAAAQAPCGDRRGC